MCFSAQASLIASAGLAVIGVISITRASTFPQCVFASIPLIFAVQQFSEGFLWISLLDPQHKLWYNPSMYAFLFFAQVLWPSFVPVSILLLEKDPKRKCILKYFTGIGILTGSYFLYCLFYYPVNAIAQSHHIKYDLEFPPSLKWISGLLYIVAAVFSPFISSIKWVRLFGCILLISYLITRIFYRDYLVSVWCYFAAVLSLVVLAIVIKIRKEGNSAWLEHW